MNRKMIVLILAAIMLLPSLALRAGGGGDGKSPGASNAPVKLTPGKKVPENFTKQTSWDVLKNVDANFPFAQYVQDEHEKWYLGRSAKLNWWIQYSWIVTDESMSKYTTLKPALDITGIDAIVTTSIGSADESVNLMMATGDYPDLMTLDPEHPLVLQLIESGALYTIEELAEKYDPGFLKEAPENARRAGTFEDGKWWGIISDAVPSWKYENPEKPYDLGNMAYMVRLDLWKALGMPSIATPDDLYNTLKLFKQKYPTMNGRNSIGIVGYEEGGQGTLINMGYSFGIRQWVTINPDTKEVNVRMLDPKYPEFIAYMNKLYREGLLDPEFFVKDIQQQMGSLTTNAFMMPWVYHAVNSANNTLKATDPNSVFVAIPPMTAVGDKFQFGSAGIGFSLMGGTGITLVPRKCKDPEAAMRLIRYAYSPAGSLQLTSGNPGEHYMVKDGVSYLPDAVKEARRADPASYTKKTGLGQYYTLTNRPIRAASAAEGTELEYDIPNSFPYSYDATAETYHIQPPPASNEGIAYNMAFMSGSRDTALAISAATAEESAAIIRNMQQNIRRIPNYDKLVKYMSAKYADNLKRFGPPKWGHPNFNK